MRVVKAIATIGLAFLSLIASAQLDLQKGETSVKNIDTQATNTTRTRKGEIEAEIRVGVSRSRLEDLGFNVTDLGDEKQWSLVGINPSRERLEPVPALSVRREEGAYYVIFALPSPKRDNLYFLRVKRAESDILNPLYLVFADGVRLTSQKYIEASLGVRPVASQSIEGGGKTPVLQVPLGFRVPELFPWHGSDRMYASGDLTLSTQVRDTTAGGKLTMGIEQYSYHLLGQLDYVHWRSELNLRSNLLATNRSLSFGSSATMPVPDSNFSLGRGFLQSLKRAELTVTPARFEYRERIDESRTPNHTKKFLFAPQASLGWDEIFPGRVSDPRTELNPSLGVYGKVWFFPDDSARGGNPVRRFEARFDVEFRIPIRRLPEAAIILGYGTGANERDNYSRSAQFTVEFQIFGNRSKVIKASDR